MANKVTYIIQLKERFARAAQKVKSSFSDMEKSAEKANTQLKKFTDQSKNIRQLSKQAAKFGAVLSASVTLPIVLMSRSMIKAASDAVETANKFDAVFSDVQGKANEVANNFSNSFGVAGSTARELIGNTGDLLVGFGFTGDKALDLSKKVNELAADLVSFQNVEGGVSVASEALTKAILGETEMAKSLGIVIRQGTKEFNNQIKSLVATRGLTEQQAKAVLILSQAQQQSKKAIGDVAKTWDTYAAVVRRNQEQTKALREQFGKILLPIALKLATGLGKLFDWLRKLSPEAKKIVLILSGLAAIAGPLVVLIAGIAAAFALISLPVMAVSAAVLAFIALGAALIANWEKVKTYFTGLWDEPKRAFMLFFNTVKERLRGLLSPLSFVAEKLGIIDSAPSAAPPAPTNVQANASLNGSITVAAEKGASIKDASMTTKSPNMNVGFNMVTQ